jgi:hypothetical protein
MNTLQFARSKLLRLLQVLLVVAGSILVGCGGGGEGGVGTGGTGTYALGTITGFGSIIVNGVRFDDSEASVLDDDDTTRGRDELKLGTTVAIDGSAIRSDAAGRSATASRIRLRSELAGPVSAVDAAAGTLELLGQTVRVGALTVFDDRLAGAMASVVAGQTIEVYGQYDAATGRYDATRIEPRDASAPWHLRGPVAAIDDKLRRLRIGVTNFDFASASAVPAALAAGDIVRVRVRQVAGPFGGWSITAFGTGVRMPEDRDEAEVKGRVGNIVSLTQFSVNGLEVDATAANFPVGSAGLMVGARVEVTGTLRGGVLRASVVSIESEDEQLQQGFDLRGAIQSVDAAGKTFVVRDNRISWARTDLRLDDGTLADIAVGRSVEVKAQLAASRTGLEATRIKFK